MEINEQITLFTEFINLNYLPQLLENSRKGKKRLVIDFKKLMRFNIDLSDLLFDNPEDTIKAAEMAIEEFDLPNKSKDFRVRIKNISSSAKVEINKLRSEHIGKIVVIEGIIKQKSDVRAQITCTRFECPVCGNVIPVLQLDERKYKEPTRCGCGRKGKFKVLNEKTMDVFSILLEETTEFLTGGSKLSKIKILCSEDLCYYELERMILQGGRIEVTGILKKIMVIHQGKKTSKIDWFLDANYIKLFEESFMNLKWDKKDIKDFNKLASANDWLARLRASIYYDIYGYEEECEGIILQMFGGIGLDRAGAQVRGSIHVLLVGDPGSSKSSLLKITQKFHPKARYVAGKGASGVGLTAAVVRDELLGGFVVEAGAIVLCNNGVLMIDELDKISIEDKNNLHEPLEEETVSISKGNVQATMVAKTSILSAANPKFGSYSEYDSIYSQIDLSPTLINRFDLVYPIKESKLTDKDNYEIAMKILSRQNTNESQVAEFSKQFIKKYIAYAKTINPSMPSFIQKYIAKKYQKLKQLKKEALEKGGTSIPVTARNLDGFRRVVEAVARSRLHKEITKEDADIGYNKIIYCLKQIGIDPETGESFGEYEIEGGGKKTYSKKDLFARTTRLIREGFTKGELMSTTELVSILVSEGHQEESIDEVVEKLKRLGEIYEPRRGFLRLTEG